MWVGWIIMMTNDDDRTNRKIMLRYSRWKDHVTVIGWYWINSETKLDEPWEQNGRRPKGPRFDLPGIMTQTDFHNFEMQCSEITNLHHQLIIVDLYIYICTHTFPTICPLKAATCFCTASLGNGGTSTSMPTCGKKEQQHRSFEEHLTEKSLLWSWTKIIRWKWAVAVTVVKRENT